MWLGALALLFLLPLTARAMVNLTPAEQSCLDDLGEISMCVDPDWEPHEWMDAQGNFTGILSKEVERGRLDRVLVAFFIRMICQDVIRL